MANGTMRTIGLRGRPLRTISNAAVSPGYAKRRRRLIPGIARLGRRRSGRYWDLAAKDLGLDWREPYSQALDLSHGAPWAEWFVDGGFNYVANALDRHANGERRNQLAVIWEGDDGAVRKLTYRELFVETNRFANALRSLGVGKGDRVGIFMPMCRKR